VVNLSSCHAARAPLGGRVKPGHDELFWFAGNGLPE
jgi:hypothetical protein